jgi:hypothetical protein
MTKKSGWSGGGIFEDNLFTEGSFECLDEPELELNDDVRGRAWESLENADVDAANRKIIWEDGKPLSIDETVQRIQQQYPEFPLDLIEEKVIVWLEGVYAPKSYSKTQLDELDRLTGGWIDDHESKRSKRPKSVRTPHS